MSLSTLQGLYWSPLHPRVLPVVRVNFAYAADQEMYKRPLTVNLCLATIKYKNPSWTSITDPQKYVFDFKE
jgi:hypothetical protein